MILRLFFCWDRKWKSIPLTPSTSELKGLFQFCLIYRDIFSQNDSRKAHRSYRLPKNWKNHLQIMTLRLFLLLKMKMEKSCHSRHLSQNWKDYSNSAWYIEIFFTKMVSEKLITLITQLTAKSIIIPLHQHNWYYIPSNSPLQAF